MSSVRVLVGTKKGAFVLTSDGKRQQWAVSGPHFPGWEIYHLKGSPADPNRLYASQSSGWFGQVMQRSNDGGAPGSRWTTSSSTTAPRHASVVRRHAAPWEFKRVWHLEPSLTDPDTVYAGVEDAAMFRTTDGGQSWHELAGLRNHGSGAKWQPGAGGLGLHTILLDPATRSGCSSPSRPPGRSAPTTAAARGRRSTRAEVAVHPRPEPRWGTASTASPCTRRARHALHAEALGRDADRRRRRPVDRGERQPADRLRLPDRRPRARAGDDLRGADHERLAHFPPEGKLRVYRSRTGGNEWEPLTKGCRSRTAT
jgi:hypothetical protein